MNGLNTKRVRASISEVNLLHNLLHISFGDYPFLFKLLLLIHFGDLRHLFLQLCYLLLTPLLLLSQLVYVLKFEQLLMQPIDLLSQLIILSLELTYHGL